MRTEARGNGLPVTPPKAKTVLVSEPAVPGVPPVAAKATTPVDAQETQRPSAPDAAIQGDAGQSTGVGAGVQALAFAGKASQTEARKAEIEERFTKSEAALDGMWAALNGLAEIGMGQAAYNEANLRKFVGAFASGAREVVDVLGPLEKAKDLDEAQTGQVDVLRKRFFGMVQERRRMML